MGIGGQSCQFRFNHGVHSHSCQLSPQNLYLGQGLFQQVPCKSGGDSRAIGVILASIGVSWGQGAG